MQKLSVEFKNTPGNASQVPCSVNEILTREETLSVFRKVLADNNSDENLLVGQLQDESYEYSSEKLSSNSSPPFRKGSSN